MLVRIVRTVDENRVCHKFCTNIGRSLLIEMVLQGSFWVVSKLVESVLRESDCYFFDKIKLVI